MKLLFWCLIGLSAFLSQAQDPCDTVQTCFVHAREQFEQCQTMLEDQQRNSNKSIDPCMQEMRSLIENKKIVHQEKERNFGDCLRREAAGNGLQQMKPKKKEKCLNVVSSFPQARFKRQPNQQFIPGISNNNPNFQIRRKQPNGNGRGLGRGNGRGFGRRKNRGRGGSQMSAFQGCMKEAKQARKQCKPLVKCCPEAAVCHLEYELSDTHDRIKSLQLQIIRKRQECFQHRDQQVSDGTIRRRDPGSFYADDFSDLDVVTEDQITEAD